MKRWGSLVLGLILLLSLVLPLTSCGESYYEYDLSPYVKFHNFGPVQAAFADPSVCTEEEIDNGVFQVMLTYANFNEKQQDEPVELYNRMTLNYCFYSEGEIMEETVTEDYTIVVGSEFNGEIDALLSQEALGKKVGDTLTLNYTYKNTEITLGVYKGMEVTVEGEITKVERQTVPVCTDSFVQKMEGFQFQTVADLRESIRQDILAEKEAAKIEAVKEAFLEGVEILSYPQKEWDDYYLQYLQDYRDSAAEFGMNLEEYLSDFLMIDEEKLKEFAREHADTCVKDDIITLHLSRLLEVELSGKEYRKGLEEMYEEASEQFESKKELEKYYGKFRLENRFLWEKLVNALAENAVAISEA